MTISTALHRCHSCGNEVVVNCSVERVNPFNILCDTCYEMLCRKAGIEPWPVYGLVTRVFGLTKQDDANWTKVIKGTFPDIEATSDD